MGARTLFYCPNVGYGEYLSNLSVGREIQYIEDIHKRGCVEKSVLTQVTSERGVSIHVVTYTNSIATDT